MIYTINIGMWMHQEIKYTECRIALQRKLTNYHKTDNIFTNTTIKQTCFLVAIILFFTENCTPNTPEPNSSSKPDQQSPILLLIIAKSTFLAL